MQFTEKFLRLAAFLLLAQDVVAGPGGYVTLINGTPYDWHQTYFHKYQMIWDWPKVIPAGTAYQAYVEYKKGDHKDDAAEVVYTLFNAPSPASFLVQGHQHPKRVEVQFQETLTSLNNEIGSLVNLGWAHNGAVSFILSGNGTGPYVSSHPPIAWMQATLPTIGSKTLREIALPASHDSGMDNMSGQTLSDGGIGHNTLAQSVNVYHQLIAGARVFDIRPVYYRGQFWSGHYSKKGGFTVGSSSRKINDIVKDINSFTINHPGELIILDISHQLNRHTNFRDLTDKLWLKLYESLNDISDLWMPPAGTFPVDLSTVPLSTFIKPGTKSAVLVRIPNSAPQPEKLIAQMHMKFDSTLAEMEASAEAVTRADHTDGAFAIPALPSDDKGDSPSSKPHSLKTRAFINEKRLPFNGEYSNTDDPAYLISDQLAKLAQRRQTPQAELHRSTWTLTQQQGHNEIANFLNPTTSIIGLAVGAHRALYGHLWNALTKDSYPNFIEVDDIHNSQIAALCMGINEYFATGASVRRRDQVLMSANETALGVAGEE